MIARWMVTCGLGLIGLASPAGAVPPLCFPERSVLYRADVLDEQGNRLGVLRAGQVVRVLDDAIGAQERMARVEVDAPVRLRGLVERKTLRVFLKQDTAVEPDWVWRLADTPVRITAATAQGVRVIWVSGDDGGASALGPQEVACAELIGTPPARSEPDICHGLLQATPSPAGEPIRLDGPNVPVLSGPKHIKTIDSHKVGLLRRAGKRALIEAIEIGVHHEPLRIRAFIAQHSILDPRSTRGWASGGCCCEALVQGSKVGQRGAVLSRDVDLRFAPSAAPFVRVPTGLRFRVLGPVERGMRKIAFRWPTWADALFRFGLEGWAEASELPTVADSPPLPMLFGRLEVEGAAARDLAGTLVSIADPWDHKGPPLDTRADHDGRFRFRIENRKGFPKSPEELAEFHFGTQVYARTADGALAGLTVATVLPGGDEEATLVLRPAATIAARVKNQVGAWLPGGAVYALTHDFFRVALWAQADREGRVALPVPPGKYTLYAADPGTWNPPQELAAPSQGTVVEQRRRAVVLGAVPRELLGCRAGTVEVANSRRDTHQAMVDQDCSFVVSNVRWEDFTIEIRPIDSPPWTRLKLNAGLLDPDPVCLGKSCGPDWRRSAIQVNVVDADNVLVQDPAKVEITSSSGTSGSCTTRAGTCLLAPLRPRQRFTVKARLGEKSGTTTIDVPSGVHDVLVTVR
jgi:hypothetical protein